MTDHRKLSMAASGGLLAATLGLCLCAPASAADLRSELEVGQQATWKIPSYAEARGEVLKWIESTGADASARQQAAASWPQDGSAAEDILDRIAVTLAALDPAAREVVELTQAPRKKTALPRFTWLTSAGKPPLERNHLRLLYGRWLVRQRLYDEARDQLAGLKPDEILDPATLLFYQTVVYHQLLDQQPGLESAGKLLERSAEIPQRYAALVRLMQADLQLLKEDDLDHIARRMGDIERRLDLGHAGPRVRGVEDGVIESLDKLIKDMEDQQKQQQASASSGSQIQSAAPAQASRPLEGKGAGQVAQKDIGEKSGWGNLPPKERQEALQQIGKEFPSHYREVIEQYFRKLAGGEREED